jgi:hypothetical protein
MFSWQFAVWVLLMHWLFDFVCQSDTMAVNKSKNTKWLIAHGAVYSLMAFTLWLPLSVAIPFYTYMLATHCCIDAITSRLTTYLYVRQQRHWFFVVIGLDQVIHYLTIFWWLSHMR